MKKNLFIYVFLLPLLVIGQNQSMKFKHLSLEDGLSQSSITCIIKDSSGFMWFGTEDGLNKYDGSTFTTYQNVPDDSTSISNSYIYAIIEQENGFLWIGTKNGLNHYNPNTEKFTRYILYPNESNSLSSNVVTALQIDHRGNLLVGTKYGLQIFNPNTGFAKATTSNNITPNFVVSIAQDKEENIWVLSSKKLEKLKLKNDSSTEVFYEKSVKTTFNNKMFLDSSHLWVGTSKGLLQLNLNTHESQTFRFYNSTDRLDKRNNILSITEGQTGRLWIGTNGGGLINFEKATGKFKTILSDPYNRLSLNSNSITNLFRDESEILWLGTHSGGINKHDPNQIQFEHYKHQNGDYNSLSESSVRSILRDSDGELWIGTHGGGLNRINRKTNKIKAYTYDKNNSSTISSNTIRSLEEDSKGTIWAGTWANGLNSLNKQTGIFNRYNHMPGEKDTLGPVPALAIDKSDHIWIGGKGLWKLDPETNQAQRYFHNEKTNIPTNYGISDLYFDQSNLLWVGTSSNGLTSLNPSSNATRQYLHNPKDSLSISHNHVTCIVEDNNGFLWVGTYGGGLNVLNTSKETFRRYDTSSGLLNDVIYGILIDDENFVWFTSNAGLCRFNPNTEEFKYFGVEYGVQSNEFNAGAYHKSKDGEFFFGGINGFNAFQPTSIYNSTNSKRIVFTEFQLLDEKRPFKNHEALDKVISRAEHITLRHSQNTFSLKFAELNYSDNSDNSYEYQLGENESLWQNLGKNNAITLGNLKPGKYQLNVRVQNNLSEKTSINIIVLPPFWRTNWAYLIYLLTILSVLTLIYRNVKKFQQTKRDFELKIANWESSNITSTFEKDVENITNSKLAVKEVPTTSMNQKFVERAIQIVEENISDSSFGVEKFMDEMFMSRSQLHRKLKASTGYSTTKFVRYIRLQRAAQLLNGNTGTVAEIAYKVGFENVGYFSKCFSETFGTPPSQYSK